jgi:UDP-N-acetyl-alpha-D-muramoyl-L-alanyl-L-glutamate epimerase
MANAQELRAKFPSFTYQEYFWNYVAESLELQLNFIYKIDSDKSFHTSLTIHSVTQDMITILGKEKIDQYVFQIGLSDLYSYWKLTASPQITIKAGFLDQEALNFWHKLLIKGMGEFFYANNIDFSGEDFVKFTCSTQKVADIQSAINNSKLTNKVLIPIGGGKDSAVTLELLKNHFDVGTLEVSTPASAQQIITIAQIPQENQVKITRTLDPQLLELNDQGFLNGHVPISAHLAFISIFSAELFGFKYIAISNERSSNEGNIWYCDQEINHQYSKSYEFEHDLQAYCQTNLPQNAPFYFSFMRPLYELQIAQIFAQFDQYHPIFRSCNRGQKDNVWCTECSKCLFAWTILFPFLGPEKLSSYFGKNLFDNLDLWPLAQDLLGITSNKPFDCVGTHEETIAAFYLSLQHYLNTNQPLPALLEKINQELNSNPKLQTGPADEPNYQIRAQKILEAWNTDHSLPDEFADILKLELEKSKVYASNLRLY